MRALVLLAIRAYRRLLSPLKGFSCAYRIHTGRSSCSLLGFRAVRRHGARRGLGILRERLALCGKARRAHAALAPRLRREAGACDLPLDFAAVADCASCSLDVASCMPVDCGSLFGARKRDKRASDAK